MTTAELIEKLNRAERPSRELDCRVWCAWRNENFDLYAQIVPNFCQWQAPFYTASIDAAMTLVPEGWSYTVAWLHRNGRATVAMFHAKLNEQRAESHTPAIALCIAALKAKEADNG